MSYLKEYPSLIVFIITVGDREYMLGKNNLSAQQIAKTIIKNIGINK